MATVTFSCQRYFIDSGEVNSKGNPKLLAVDRRKMYLDGDFIWTNHFEINLMKRGGERIYSVKHIAKPKTQLWPNLNEPAYKIKWVRDGSYTQDEFVKWLKLYLVDKAETALWQMLTYPPDNLAA